MNLRISDQGTGLREEVLTLLNQYGNISPVFKKRLNADWHVELVSGATVDAHTDGTAITVSIPPVQKTDTLREVVEAILFECGNAARSGVFRSIKRKFLELDTPVISMLEYALQKTSAEAENFWEYAKGLNDMKSNNFVLSFQGRKQMKDVEGLDTEARYADKFRKSPHNPNSPDSVQRRSSLDMYAYELIRDPYELKLWKILQRVVTGGTHRDLFVNVLLKKATFTNMSQEDRIPSWCTIMDIVNKAIALSPGCWVKVAGYDFTIKMLEAAMLESFNKAETNNAFNDQLAEIKQTLGLGAEFHTPHWLK
ncbi:MAG: hypothetical protein C4581_03555 [Nitrospiraceae bacterium]|nr:MAG: hypothetical protein C4581_03555 [Nitrospiraceae bacterium]